MKVTIEVDCTPLEARQFFGLPDVQPMQTVMLAEMEKRMLAEAAKFSPEGMMQAWFSNGAQGADWFRQVMGGMFPGAAASLGAAETSGAAPKK